MRSSSIFYVRRWSLLSVVGLLLASESDSHVQGNNNRNVFGKRLLTALYLAQGPNTIVPRFTQDHSGKRQANVFLSGSSDSIESWDEVEKLKAVLELHQNTFGEDNEITLASMNAYGAKLLEVEEFGTAQSVLQDFCELARKKLDRGHVQTILGLTNLADICIKAGGEFSPLRLAEAARLKKEVFEIKRDAIGKDHPETVEAADDYKAILRRIADIEGELDEDDFLRLGFDLSTIDEVIQDYLDACDPGVLSGKVVLIGDGRKSGANQRDHPGRNGVASHLKKPFKALWHLLRGYRGKSNDSSEK